MSDSIIQLPYTGTTSGQLLDSEQVSVGGNTVERERMQISGASATQIAPVTSSGGLLVTLSTVPGYLVTLSSNPTVILSSPTSLSSGIVTLSSAPTVNISSGVITLSSNPTVNISSGTVTLSSNPTVDVSSGVITLSSATSLSSGLVSIIGSSGGTATVTTSGGLQVELTNGSVGSGSTAVNVVGSSNAIAPATSSGGLLVTFTNSVSGSTAVNILGSTGTMLVITSAGVGEVQIASSGGINAPVTSSFGLAVSLPVATRIDTIQTSIGTPVTKTFTTESVTWFSLSVVTTAAVGHAVKFYTATSLTSDASTYFQAQMPAVANIYTFPFAAGGVTATGGLYATVTLNATSTSSTTTAYQLIAQYRP